MQDTVVCLLICIMCACLTRDFISARIKYIKLCIVGLWRWLEKEKLYEVLPAAIFIMMSMAEKPVAVSLIYLVVAIPIMIHAVGKPAGATATYSGEDTPITISGGRRQAAALPMLSAEVIHIMTATEEKSVPAIRMDAILRPVCMVHTIVLKYGRFGGSVIRS